MTTFDLLLAQNTVSLLVLGRLLPVKSSLAVVADIPAVVVNCHFLVRGLGFEGLVVDVGGAADEFILAGETVLGGHEVLGGASGTDWVSVGV